MDSPTGENAYVPSTFVQESSKPISSTSNSITLKLENEDIAFVLGRGGVTKQKLAKVSDVRLDIDEKAFTLTIVGPEEKRRRAHEYIDMVVAQRKGGAVQVDLTQPRSDLTVVQVPTDCVGYVTGGGGKVLRGLEMDWGTLMFFLTPPRSAPAPETETLVIFGPRRGRIGAALKVMSAVEHKRKEGYYVKDSHFQPDFAKELDIPDNVEGFLMEQMPLKEVDFSYALGKEGKTRKKLAKASGCILEYVGLVAVMVGTQRERQRAKDYLDWLLLQRTGQCDVVVDGRDDVSSFAVEAKYVGWVTGVQGKNFRQIEEDTGCYLFTNRSGGPKLQGEEMEHILIFSHDSACRDRAERAIKRSIEEKRTADSQGSRIQRGPYGESRRDGGGDRFDRRGAGGDYRSSRQRSRSPPSRRRNDSPPPRHRNRSVSPDDRRRRDSSPAPRRRDVRDDSPRSPHGGGRSRRDDSDRDRRRDDDRGGRRDDGQERRGRGRSRDRR